jgi:hypothetical protein
MLVCFFISHARLRVRWASGFPCALSLEGQDENQTLRENARGENAEVCRHRPRRRAIQYSKSADD